MKTIIFVLLAIMSFSKTGFTQDFKFKGWIVDEENSNPLNGAVIHQENANNYTVTDEQGMFELMLDSGNVAIVISHLGYKSKRVNVKNRAELKIKLNSAPIETDVVVVTGNPLEDITHSIVITDDIKRGSQIRNTAELFNDIPGFSLQKRSATAIEPSFRSFKYEEMNMKFDGGAKIVQACPNRMDPMTAHLIPEEVSKIEVIKGPYTVRYGQRFGPTVNIITKTPTADNYGFHGRVEAGYETNGNNLLGRAELMYAQKKFDVTLNGESRNFGDYVDGTGTIVPSGFITNSYSVKTGINPTKKQRININWRQKFGQDIKHAGLPMDSPKDDSWLLSADYKYINISKKLKSLSFKGYTSSVDHIMDNFSRPSFMMMEASTPVQSQTYGGKMELIFMKSPKMLVFTGLDADVIARQGERTMIMKKDADGVPLEMPMIKKMNVWQDAVIQDYGVFVESTYKLSKLFTATAGIRADYVMAAMQSPGNDFLALYGDKVDDKTDVTIGGNVSLKYLKKGWLAQLAYGRGTRTASMVERYIYRFTVGMDPRQYIGNPNLKPEINNQFEISLTKKYEKLSFGSSIYYSLFKDYITAKLNPDFIPATGGNGLAPRQFWNVDAEQYGFEAFLKYKFYKNFTFSTDVNYTVANNKSFNEPLAQIAPLTTHIGIKWEKDKFWLDLRGDYMLKQDRISVTFGETETPSYFTLDLRAGIKPVKDVTIGLAVLNIFDNAYYNHLNFSYKNSDINQGRIYEPGRSFSFFAKFKF